MRLAYMTSALITLKEKKFIFVIEKSQLSSTQCWALLGAPEGIFHCSSGPCNIPI